MLLCAVFLRKIFEYLRASINLVEGKGVSQMSILHIRLIVKWSTKGGGVKMFYTLGEPNSDSHST